MSRNDLHLPALNAILDVSTSDRRFKNRSHIAAGAGITESHLSYIASGKRGVSEPTLIALAHALGVSPDAIRAPGSDEIRDEVNRLGAEIAGVRELLMRLTKEQTRLKKQVGNTTE